MTVISVNTRERNDGKFEVAYRAHDTQALAAGTVTVDLTHRETRDRPIIAELAALQYLLCEEEVCGQSRTGQGLAVEVSFGAIKRAVRQGAIQASGIGRTDKAHIVPYAHFLATRFFEADKTVVPNPAWAKGCLLKYRTHAITVAGPKEESLPTHIGDAVISRHALARYVERFIARDLLAGRGDADREEADRPPTLEELDPKYWTHAWKSLARLLVSNNTVITGIACSKFGERMVSRHGKQARTLYHPDARAIFILVPEGRRLVLATVLRDFEDNRLLQRSPRYIGGRLVPA